MPDDPKPDPPRKPRPKRLVEGRTLDLIAARLDELKPRAALSLLEILKARYEPPEPPTKGTP